jgi:UDP-3-O-[3-hydroxymyristoyl] glucosamine N-acyltransferase
MIAHAGGVLLRDRVEVQANSVVCRAVFNGFTEIGEDTKLGNQVGISHGVRIGRRCRVAAGAQVTGSVRVGDDVWIGPNATISNRVRIGDGARISLGAVVVAHVAAGTTVTGSFAVDHRASLASWRRARRGRRAD